MFLGFVFVVRNFRLESCSRTPVVSGQQRSTLVQYESILADPELYTRNPVLMTAARSDDISKLLEHRPQVFLLHMLWDLSNEEFDGIRVLQQSRDTRMHVSSRRMGER